MKKRPIIYLCCISLLISILICGIQLYQGRTIQRAPTQAEIDGAQAYKIHWDSPEWETYAGPGSDKVQLLAMCQPQEDKQVDGTWYKSYTSSALHYCLYQCVTIGDILLSEDGILRISYYALDDRQVILSFVDEGMTELVIFHQPTNTMYRESGGEAVILENAGSGI